MAIKSGEDTFHQAKRGVVQDGLTFSIDTSIRNTRSATTIRSVAGNRNVSIFNGSEFNNSRGGFYKLDGTDDYFSIVENGSVPVANFPISISCWFKTTTSSSVDSTIYMQTSKPSSSPEANIVLSINTNHSSAASVVYSLRSGTNIEGLFDSSVTVTDGDWHNVVGVSSSSNNHKLYIDGDLIDSGTTDIGSISTYLTSVIGCYYQYNERRNRVTLNRFFNGDISRFSIYNKALTATEVARNFKVTRHRFGV